MLCFFFFYFFSALSGLLTSLQETHRNVCTSDEEFMFLNNLLRNKELHALFQIHDKIVEEDRRERFRPVFASSMQIVLEILDMIMPYLEENADCKELFYVLQKPHLQVITHFFFVLLKLILVFLAFIFRPSVLPCNFFFYIENFWIIVYFFISRVYCVHTMLLLKKITIQGYLKLLKISMRMKRQWK